MTMLSLAAINTQSVEAFVATLGGIFEHSPWVAEAVVGQRPFASVAALHRAMVAAVDVAGEGAQLALLQAHPDLAGKLARAGALTDASTREQAGAGLDQLTDAEYHRFEIANMAYRDKFGFPFIIAVKGHDKHSILTNFEARVKNDRATELQTALAQVARIGGFRLAALVQD